jgi:ATP-dependent DNA helicase RecG
MIKSNLPPKDFWRAGKKHLIKEDKNTVFKRRIIMLGEMEILKLIQNKENSFVEFKEDAVDNKKIAQEMIAFSNHKGGYLLLGVNDDEKPVGLTRTDNEERIMNISSSLIRPMIIPVYYETNVGGKKIAVIEIENGSNKPYYLEDKSLGLKNFFMRYGSTTREIKHRDELQRLFQSSQNIHYEVIPASYATLEDIDIQSADKFLSETKGFILKSDDIKIVLRNIDIITETENGLKPTIAGMLLFGKDRVKNILPQSRILCTKIKGTVNTDEKQDVIWLEKNVLDNCEGAISFFKKYNAHSFSVNGSIRTDRYLFPEKVFRELIVNAIIHRDYTITGSEVQVWIYEDRIEIKSPGAIPNTITVEKMKFGAKYHRNPVLAQFFYYAGYAEMMGQGIPMVDKWLEENGNPPLEIIVENENELLSIIRREKEPGISVL